VIPTMILFGLVAGRWWKTALVLGALGWAALLYFSDIISLAQVPAAAGLGLANTAVGVAIHQGVLWIVRRSRRHAASDDDVEAVPPTVG